MNQKVIRRPGHRAPAGYDGSKYARPSVACDVVIVSFRDLNLEVLLIERRHAPYEGFWALPGGFVEMDEGLEAAAAREVMEETGVSGLCLEPIGMFGNPERDPRGRVISAAYLALIRPPRRGPKAGDDAARAEWFPLRRLPGLAFDHDKIIAAAKKRIQELFVLTPAAFDLLPRRFSRTQMHVLCQEAMGRRYRQRSFFRTLERLPGLKPDSAGPDGDPRYTFRRQEFSPGHMMFLLNGGAVRRRSG